MYYQNKVHLYWLVSCCIILLLLIIVGGLTRLTDSGLSITNWEIFTGILPPLNQQEWSDYFKLYKQIPEYKQINFDMSLSEFKIIFWWEYAHRILARFTVIIFVVPMTFFILNKEIRYQKLTLSLFVCFLFFLQGFLGWYMVKSGLVNNVDVSHFRLAMHLFTAIIIYSLLFWLLLNYQNSYLLLKLNNSNIALIILLIVTYIQIIFGAFVSGLDAGLIYQTWPLMNESFIANDIDINSIFSLESLSTHSYIQFYHRILAYLILIIFIVSYFNNLKNKIIAVKYFNYIFLAILFQIILGIFTLLSGLNIFLASFHQIGSILLISTILLAIYKSSNLIDNMDLRD